MSEKLKANVYQALPLIFEKIKVVALEKVMGRTDAWVTMRLHNNMMGGKPLSFSEDDLVLVNRGLEKLGEQIAGVLVQFSDDRDAVIAGIRNANIYIAMPYIYEEVWKKDRQWFANRMRKRKPGGKASSFKEEDILKMNMAIMQIANELRSIELTL